MYNILLTAIGKRVQLIKHLKKNFKVMGVDVSYNNPALSFVDRFYQVPRYDDAEYVQALLELCRNEDIKLVIPLYEKEFDVLVQNKELFQSLGTTLLLSDKSIIDICNNKMNTYKFFKSNDILTPDSYTKAEVQNKEDIVFPMLIKPVDGMGSQGVYKINNKKELVFFVDYIPNPIIQEFIEGIEYTVDVLCDFFGNIISIVPRQRIEIRSGEVSKSKTVKDNRIINATRLTVEKLKRYGKVTGPMTVQCIVDHNNKIYFIEINPRFGGGVPLTFEAGVDYGFKLLEMIEGKPISPIIGQFSELTMLRYDEGIFRS